MKEHISNVNQTHQNTLSVHQVYTKNNLRDYNPDDKVVNYFEEILRHNNVSDKENAFNRLTVLFICKLEDELSKGDDDELDFRYEEEEDYESLLTRLQSLYYLGMKDLMQEDTFEVKANYVDKLFPSGEKVREKSVQKLKETLCKLQSYSHNEFAFIDVYNEETFRRNGKVLSEVVQLFQPYRFISSSSQQLLGDLFEQLLYKNFKQNEGQFFTPVPLTRFIWRCLPVEQFIQKNGETPKIIDYACGSGHFLTEAFKAISNLTGNNIHAEDYIYGVEKDCRLVRISKISLLMNGSNGTIVSGDGLDDHPEKEIEKEGFDILTANPPYSVSGFKPHLDIVNTFDLADRITKNGGEIEVLFVERTVQLLKPGGVAALLLPLTVLTNTAPSYIGAREKILANFQIHAIVQLSDQAFKTTKTPTVILFLEKYEKSIERENVFSEILRDKNSSILKEYLKRIGVSKELYLRFLNKEYSLKDLEGNHYFNLYLSMFSKKKAAKESPEYFVKFYDFVLSKEKEKIFYFSLVYKQKTILILSPHGKKEQAEFLGYSWSGVRGREGIRITNHGGKLYDDSNRQAPGTLAYIIRKSFSREESENSFCFTEEQKKYAYIAETKDLLDFSRVPFKKTIRTNLRSVTVLKSAYPSFYARDIFTLKYGKCLPAEKREHGNVVVAGSNGPIGTHSKALVKGPVIVVGRKGSAGSVCFIEEDCWPIDTTYFIEIHSKDIQAKYLYYVLLLLNLPSLTVQAGIPALSSEDVYELKIPVPSVSTQQEIICLCDEIRRIYRANQITQEEYRTQITRNFKSFGINCSF